ncbi:cupin domain-containing protein [Rubrobacter indicoceani]|uniref:cupin domain-containing protein n=1 Tax=Rubrobacter indicoceani TaxID=2051957 RepID=UPI000E5A8606|nr:cupin domain-containing protein [Rubrobacter indicoceani]
MSAKNNPDAEAREFLFRDDGRIPNSPLPLLFYPRALSGRDLEPSRCKKLFAGNNWLGAWVNGVFSFHHYHSTSHEVLAVITGSANITFGGENGETVEAGAGDVVVIPAGVGHCNRGSSRDFRVIGAYPEGRSYDLLTGEPDERPQSLENIGNVPLPKADPLSGPDGPLRKAWRP